MWRLATASYGPPLVMLVVAFLGGRTILRKVKFDSHIESIAISTTLGLVALSLTLLLLGSLHLLYPAAVIALGAIPTVAAWVVFKPLSRVRELDSRQLAIMPLRRITLVAAGMVFVILTLVWFWPVWQAPLYPPVTFDAIMYHLPAAQSFVDSHSTTVSPYARFPVFTHLNEVLFAVMLMFGPVTAAHALQALLLALLGLAMIAFTKRVLGYRAPGALAFWLLLSTPLFVYLGSTGYVDISLALLVFCAVHSLVVWAGTKTVEWLWLAAAFAGAAVGVKYSAMFFALVLVVIVAILASKGTRARSVLNVAAFGIATSAPWLIRNLIFTGNPVFPFFTKVFHQKYFSPEDVSGVMADLGRYGIGKSFGAVLQLPYMVATSPNSFHADASLLPVFYPLFFLAVFAGIFIKGARIPLIMIITFGLFWSQSTQVLRYLTPILPIILVLAALLLVAPWRWLADRYRLPHWIGIAVLVAVIVGSGNLKPPTEYLAQIYGAYVTPPTTAKDQSKYLAERLPTYGAYAELNNRHGRDYTVYAYHDESMKYHARGVHIGDHFGPGAYREFAKHSTDGKSLYRWLRGMGVDYLLLADTSVRLPPDTFFQRAFKREALPATGEFFRLVEEKSLRNPANTDSGPSKPAELLIDPGFEESGLSTPAWNPEGGGLLDRTGRNSHKGQSAAFVNGPVDVFTQSLPVTPNTPYFLSHYSRTVKGEGVIRLQINWTDSSGKYLGATLQTRPIGATWRQNLMSFVSPKNATYGTVYAAAHDGTSAWMDDFSLTAANPTD